MRGPAPATTVYPGSCSKGSPKLSTTTRKPWGCKSEEFSKMPNYLSSEPTESSSIKCTNKWSVSASPTIKIPPSASISAPSPKSMIQQYKIIRQDYRSTRSSIPRSTSVEERTPTATTIKEALSVRPSSTNSWASWCRSSPKVAREQTYGRF